MSPVSGRPVGDLWRLIAAVAFAVILVSSFQSFYLQPFFRPREPLARHLDGLRFGKAPELRGLFSEVRIRTAKGDRIALVTPVHRWDEGYAYAYYRASYILAGREVVPLVLWGDKPAPENIRHASHVIVWNTSVNLPGFERIWESEAGALYRRRE